jgi:hypothetical protein
MPLLTKLQLVITSDIPHGNLELIMPPEVSADSDWTVSYNPPRDTPCDFWIVFTTSRPADRMVCAAENTLYLAGEPPSKKIHTRSFYGQFYRVHSCHADDPHPLVQLGAPCLNWHYGLDTSTHRYRISFKELEDSPVGPKSKKVAVICSHQRATEGQRKRLKFLETLKQELAEDLVHFGRGFQSVDDKMEAIAPYAYHLVLENCCIPHYWSEKLADAYLGWSYPFYVGAPNLDTYFERDSFEPLDWREPIEAAKTIRRALEEDRFATHFSALARSRNKILHDYNLFSHCLHLAKMHYLEGRESRQHSAHSHKAFRTFPQGTLHRLNAGVARILK